MNKPIPIEARKGLHDLSQIEVKVPPYVRSLPAQAQAAAFFQQVERQKKS